MVALMILQMIHFFKQLFAFHHFCDKNVWNDILILDKLNICSRSY